MKKYQIMVNNVERVTDYVNLYKDIRTVYMNSIFAQKELKKLAKKVPKNFDKESIKAFENETGLILKYWVFYNKYDFFEYTSLGIWPDNEKIANINNGKYVYNSEMLKINHIENYDILVIDRITNIKRANK